MHCAKPPPKRSLFAISRDVSVEFDARQEAMYASDGLMPKLTHGALANLVAHQDELRSVQRANAAQVRLKARRRLESVDLALDGLGEIVDVIAEMEQLERDDEKKD